MNNDEAFRRSIDRTSDKMRIAIMAWEHAIMRGLSLDQWMRGMREPEDLLPWRKAKFDG